MSSGKRDRPSSETETSRGHEVQKVKKPRPEFRHIRDEVDRDVKMYVKIATKNEKEARAKKQDEAQRRFEAIEAEHVKLLEQQLGFEKAPEFLKEIRDIVDNLVRAAGIKEKINLVPLATDEINAYVFTMADKRYDEEREGHYSPQKNKGQFIFLHTGLVRALGEYQSKHGSVLSQDTIAFILAHEIRHLLQQRKQQDSMLTVRDQEYDADLGALEIMGVAGYNPREAITGMEFLASLSEEQSPYSATHPASKSRLVEMKKRIADPDIPMRGIGKEPAAFQNIPATKSKLSTLSKDLKDADFFDTAISHLFNRTETTADAVVTLPLIAEAARHGVICQFAENPALRGLYVKYLYSIGAHLFEEQEKEKEKLDELKQRQADLSGKAKRTKKEESELAELNVNIYESEKRSQAFEKAKSKCANASEDLWGQAWRDVPVAQTATLDTSKYQSQIDYFLRKTVSVSWEVSNKNWEQIDKDWVAGKLNDPKVSGFIELGMKIQQAADPQSESALASSDGRRAYAEHFTRMRLDEDCDYKSSPLKRSSPYGIDAAIENAVQEAISPLIDKMRVFISSRIPNEYSERVREISVDHILACLFPYSGVKTRDFYDKEPSLEQQAEHADVVRAILTVFPEVYFSRPEIQNNYQKHYFATGLQSTLLYMPRNTVQNALSSEFIDTAIERLLCKFPKLSGATGHAGSIEELDYYKQESDQARNIKSPREVYEQRVAEGAPEKEIQVFRREIGNTAFARTFYNKELAAFLLSAYGIRPGIGKDLDGATPLQFNEVEIFVKAMIKDGLKDNRLCGALEGCLSSDLIALDDIYSQLLIQSLFQRFQNIVDKRYWLGKKLPLSKPERTASALDMPMKQLLSTIPALGLALSKEVLEELVREKMITREHLKKYYEDCERYEERHESIVLNQKPLGGRINSFHSSDVMKVIIETVGSDLGIKRLDMKSLGEIDLSFEQIIDFFPKSLERNTLLFNAWKRTNFDPSQRAKIMPHFLKSGWGSNSLDVGDQIGFGTAVSIENEEKAKELEQRYFQLKEEGVLEEGSRLHAFSGKGYDGFLEMAFRQDPDSFVDTTLSFRENADAIVALRMNGDFRDLLLVSALKKDYCVRVGLPVGQSVHGIRSAFDVSVTPLAINKCDTLFFDDFELPRGEQSTLYDPLLIENIRHALPLLRSQTLKTALGRLGLERSRPATKEDELGLIKEFFEKPSRARDSILKDYMLKNSLPVEQIRELRKLLTSEIIKEGGDRGVGGLFSEIFHTESFRLEPKKRSELLLWLVGALEDPPFEMRVAGGMFGVHYESQRTNFGQLTVSEKNEFFGNALLYDNGIFQPETPEDEDVMEDFIGKVFDAKLESGMESDGLLKDVVLTVFRKSLPERRYSLFMALYLALEKNEGKKMQFEDLLPLLLENSGMFGVKAAQVLSERSTLPLSPSGEKMPESLKRKLSKVKEHAEPFNTIGVVYALDDSDRSSAIESIDALAGAASLKQAHIATRKGGGRQIEKVRKPSVEKYIQHDIEVVRAVCNLLNERGFHIPKHFVEYIFSLVQDEADFYNEAKNQQLFAQSIPAKCRGWELKVPHITFASADLIEEDLALGESLDSLREKNPTLSKEASRLIGVELLKGLFERGIFHADLHDGNIFVDEKTKTLTYIDAGSVGEIQKEELGHVRKLFKALYTRNAKELARCIVNLSEKGDEENTSDLTAKLEALLKCRLPLHEMISRISFEILDFAMPKKSLRYFLKALTNGAPHIQSLTLQDKAEIGSLLAYIAFA